MLYVYEDQSQGEELETKPAGQSSLTAASFEVLPVECVTNLIQALYSVDLDLIAAAIAQIRSYSEALADAPIDGTDNFKYELILNLSLEGWTHKEYRI